MDNRNLSRRRFLARTAGWAGVSIGIGVRPQAAAAGPSTPIRLGFAGLGDRGRRLLGSALRRVAPAGAPQVEVVALADPAASSLRRALSMVGAAGGSARPLTDHRRLLDLREIDAVFIATPNFLHAPILLDSLSAGKHVYCEKPLVHRASDGGRVLLAAREAARRGAIVQAGFQRRYNPRYRAGIELIHAGEIGEVRCVRAQWHTTGNARRDKAWLHRQEKSGGVLLEQACHQLDVCNWLFQEPPRRACGLGGVFSQEAPYRDSPDHYGVVLEYPSGAKAFLTHLDVAVPDRRFAGIYELVFAERAGVDLGNGIVWFREGGTRRLDVPTGSDTDLAVEAFLEAISSGRLPEASVDVALEASLTAILCQRAIDVGATVGWNDVVGST